MQRGCKEERCAVEVRRRTRPLGCFVNVKSVDRILEWSQHTFTPLYTSRLASLHPLGLLTWRSSSATTFLCQTDRSVKLTDEHASWYTGPCRCGQQKRPYQKDSKDHQHLFKGEESYLKEAGNGRPYERASTKSSDLLEGDRCGGRRCGAGVPCALARPGEDHQDRRDPSGDRAAGGGGPAHATWRPDRGGRDQRRRGDQVDGRRQAGAA